MKKILSLALALSASVLMAQPMGQGMMDRGSYGPMGQGMMYGCQGGLMEKCECDTKQLPRALEALELSDKQKTQIAQLREDGKAFHNKQQEKMMSILTAEQRGKIEYLRKLKDQKRSAKGGMGGMGCMGCKNCN